MDADLGGIPLPAVLVEGGTVLDANAAALALGPQAMVGEPLAKWFDAEVEAIVAWAFEPRGPNEPAVVKVRDAERWVELHTAGVPADHLQVVVLRDATDERFVRAAVDAVADSTFVIRGDGANRWRSARLRERSSQSDDEAARTPAGERIHPEDLPRVFEVFTSVAEDVPSRVIARSRAVDDDDRWETIEIVVWNRLTHDVIQGYLVQVHNLDEGRIIESPLGDDDTGLLSLTEAAPVGIAVTDPAGQFVYRNPAAKALLGPGVRSFGDLDWVDLARPEHRTALATAFDAAMHDGIDQTITAAFEGTDGDSDSWLRLRIEPQQATDGRHKGLIVTIEDVSEQVATSAALAAAEERMRYLATHDSLTGLPNRAALNDELERAARRHERAASDLHVLFCDLDGFKPVNDRLGHAGGDAVLVEVARRLRSAVRGGDFVARLGGDEFVVLCETGGDDRRLVHELTERLDDQVRQPIVVAGETVSVGVSVGVATARQGERADADALLTGADEAMYRSKAARRGGRDLRSESA
jgi:diguanylate cyclase (GGDEF)-like protein/PAS domain S-box-containing protein